MATTVVPLVVLVLAAAPVGFALLALTMATMLEN